MTTSKIHSIAMPVLIFAFLLTSTPTFAKTFQAEDFSFYNDTTPGNIGNVYRNTNVDIQPTQDLGGGFNVGWIAATEWLTWSDVKIETSGNYIIRVRVASPNGARMALDFNAGSIPLTTFDIPATGGWQTWQTLETTVHIQAGTYNLGMYAISNGWNFNWIEITPSTTDPAPNLTWSEEFNTLNTAIWNYAEGDNVNNHELQWYAGANNIKIDFDPTANSHVLIIEAKKEEGGPCWHGNNCAYTSGKIQTRYNKSIKYGRIEARMRLPKTAGIWPAFWMLGDDFNVSGWPRGGEIDIMEHINDTNVTSAALHGPGYSGNTPFYGATTVPDDIANNYHIYAIEWDSQKIRWFVDDNNFYTATRTDVEQFGPWVYDQPFWLILNVAVGGTLPDNPDSNFQTQRMYVDYIRTYNLTIEETCSASTPYGGIRFEPPGRLEAENYDDNCDEFGGHKDSTTENIGGEYRTDSVDIEATSDSGSGFNVGWTEAGESLTYSINVPAAGRYDILLRAASDGINSNIHFSLNGNKIGETVQLRNTGGWQAWRSVTGGTFELPEGEHHFTIHIEKGGFNLNYIDFIDASDKEDPNKVHTADRSRGEWTLLTVPDTQHYSQNRPNAPIENMRIAFDWIVEKKDQLNIQFVQGLGDIVEGWDAEWEWQNSTSAWYKLRGKVPFMPITGNHDDPWTMNQYFPVSMFSGEPWWGGSSGGIENNYALMTIGNEDYMFLQIETYDQFSRFNPTGLNFGKQVLEQHPNRKVILATHDTWETNTIKDNLLTKFDNIILSNAGHTCTREALYQTTGPNGGVAHNFIADYQCDAQEVMLLRYYIFKPMEDKVEYYTYSPVTQQFEADASSQGEFTLIQKDP